MAESAFSAIRHHVLLPWAGAIEEAAAYCRGRLDTATFAEILHQVPDAWLLPEPGVPSPDAKRVAYAEYFTRRLRASSNFVQEAIRARARIL